jgi:hypothetical protein
MAERDGFGQPVFAFFDDWVNQRARHPGYVVTAAVLGMTAGVAGLPLIAAVPIATAVGNVPALMSLFMWTASGNPLRYTRPGLFQRPAVIAKVAARENSFQAKLLERARRRTAELPDLRTVA